jgi:hypothetical protein
VPAQCGGNGGGSAGYGGGGKHSTVVIYGNHKKVLTRQRREHDEVMPEASAAAVVPSLLVRAKRGWAVDVKSEIQMEEKQKNKAHSFLSQINLLQAAKGYEKYQRNK